jgi:AGCS family alanine or glycine:cation symporter
MNKIIEIITNVNGSVNDAVWGLPGLVLLIGTGIIITFGTKFFQVVYIGHWFKNTIFSVFKKDTHKADLGDKKAISQFQAFCAALASTIGTGNIVGVSVAIVTGGPGAVFWMWVAAFFGMMTNFAENVLGIYYRRKNANGEWSGGPMYYLRDGLGKRYKIKWLKPVGSVLAIAFAVFTIIASFGIGNMTQINTIVSNIDNAFFASVDLGSIPGTGIDILHLILGGVLVIISAVIILGGIQRIAKFTEIVVPIMAIVYIIGGIIIVGLNIENVGNIVASIFKFAVSPAAFLGGGLGVLIQKTMTQGFKRGVFSNEAGLGSSVMLHAASDTTEPVKQGMWGIFAVFFDTLVVCSMTALIVLSSGYINLETGAPLEAVSGSTLVSEAFGQHFGAPGAWFVAIAILFFAFTTVIGWSEYGSKAFEYLFGTKGAKIYKFIFIGVIIFGAIIDGGLAWDLSDTFNGLMMIPNLIGVLALLPLVLRITKNYVDRNLKHKKVKPILSYNKETEKEAIKKSKEQ